MYDCEKDKKVDDDLLSHKRRREGIELFNKILDDIQWSNDIGTLVVDIRDIERAIYLHFGVEDELDLKETK